MSAETTGRARYHHGDLAAALVAAGLELARAGGPDALSLREVTRRVGVSPNAAYRHFASRQALLSAVSREIESAMAARMVSSGAFDGPLGSDLLRAVGLGYIDFALDEPGWFAVAFFDSLDPADDRQVAESPAYRALVHALDQMVADGELPASARAGAQWPCWSAVHGFAELALYGPLRTVARDEVRALARRTVDATVAGITAA